ncbi:AraC family transcriptional regulator [Tabrizicola sp. J26]|uniref:AraC family transcriptional regulator n=1 Tax=Alitabrizicola rongguiensis TaxID=2909234 RepID=UPI001F19D7DD|nr:AraC family transcriptional regulator [Tabrizicola rongguiensis]MCF1708102.1 AraC family transcriptional regulator [Tabrizicola rongguiensis]
MTHHHEKRLNRVLDYIHDNPTDDLSLDRLAEVAALSRFHFHRLWRAMTLETAAQTVRRMRLHRAAVALVTGTTPVAQIAGEVGYPDADSFSRAFADLYGVPPSSYRHRGQHRPPLLPTPTGDDSMPDVTIRTEPRRRLAAVTHTGPYSEIGRAFEKLFTTLAARGLLVQAGSMLALYYDDPSTVPPEQLRSHAGIALPEGAEIAAPLEEVIVDGGRTAVLTHRGPYAGLPASWDALYRGWLATCDEEPADRAPYEVYLNTPMEVRQGDLLTEICVPLK